jgi:hypothetical protein
MSSFYAQLTVDGQPPYPLRQCQFEFTQVTDQRGRAAAKVRHGLLHLTLDVPTDDQLLDWANTVHKPLSGHLTFFEDDRRTARETVSFAAGQCVSYQETFVAGDGEAGAYVCQLLITSAELTLAPGGAPQPFVAPAAREHGVPTLTGVTPSNSLITSSPVDLTSHLPTKQQKARLAALRRLHKNQSLTPAEEIEVIALLATVLSIHVPSLNQLTPKPKHAPLPPKWQSKKGRIDVLPNGFWKYTDWEGNSVTYEPDEPNFDLYALQQVDIEDMQGDCSSDFVKANAGAPLGPKKDTSTWHHKNNLQTMQEVPRKIHDRFTHFGARSIIKKRKLSSGPAVTPTSNKPVIKKRKS